MATALLPWNADTLRQSTGDNLLGLPGCFSDRLASRGFLRGSAQTGGLSEIIELFHFYR